MKTTLLFTDSNTIKAKLIVGRARKYTGRMVTLLDSGVYVEFYNKESQLDAILIADSALIDDTNKDMIAFGRVHIRSDRTQTIVDTDRLHWTNQTRMLHSDAPVSIVDSSRGRSLKGVGFESDESLETYRIFNASGRTIGEPK